MACFSYIIVNSLHIGDNNDDDDDDNMMTILIIIIIIGEGVVCAIQDQENLL
jgi:hypothetical protein